MFASPGSASVSASCGLMRAVTKKISSDVLLMVLVLLNKFPTIGMLPNPGTCRMLTESLSRRIPPMTAVPPSGINTWVCACCVETDGMPLTARAKSGWLFSMETVNRIVPASVICGVTVRFKVKRRN